MKLTTVIEALREGLITTDTDLTKHGIDLHRGYLTDALLTNLRPVLNSRIKERWRFEKTKVTSASVPGWATIIC